MITVDFSPRNEEATSTFMGVVNARRAIEEALRKDLPQDFHGDLSGQEPLPDELLEAAHEICGELPVVTRACLSSRPFLSVYSKAGKVFVRLASDDLALGDRVAKTLEVVLHTASMGRGKWSSYVEQVSSRIELSPHDTLFQIPRLELPIPCTTDIEELPWVEDCLGDAIYAAMINQALWSATPREALAALPRRRAISAIVDSSNTHERYPMAGTDMDVVSYSWVKVEANLQVEGLVFIGLGASLCNGLLGGENQW